MTDAGAFGAYAGAATTRRAAFAVTLAAVAMTTESAQAQPDLDALHREVWQTEVAFARSMAERDIKAFARHLSEHAVFWAGKQPLRGKATVVQAWQRFFEGAQAPFSWEPDEVVVLGDGSLAQSTGPVRDPGGKPIARFRSVWRREGDGRWLIVLDRGEPADPPTKP